MNKNMKRKIMGLRSLKTIIAVTIAYFVGYFIPNLSEAVMAAAAITAMDVSISDSFKSGFVRIFTNIIAIITSFILQSLNLGNPVGIAIGLTFIILLCNLLNVQNLIGTTSIFFVFVVDVAYTNQNLEIYALNRMIDTVLGTIIGLLVNAWIFRPRREKYLFNSYRSTYIDLRNGLKDLLEEDKSVDEFYLIDSVSLIHDNTKRLRNDTRIKMNEGINSITVSKLNNLFRTALSLIIELNELDDYPIITEKNRDELALYFKGDFKLAFDVGEPVSEFDERYNYELSKLIDTLESIEYNLHEYTTMYNRIKDRWYLERKN